MPPNPLMRSALQPRHGLAQGGVATPFRGGRAVHNVFDRSPDSPGDRTNTNKKELIMNMRALAGKAVAAVVLSASAVGGIGAVEVVTAGTANAMPISTISRECGQAGGSLDQLRGWPRGRLQLRLHGHQR